MLFEELFDSLVWDIDILSSINNFFEGWQQLLVKMLIIFQSFEEVIDV